MYKNLRRACLQTSATKHTRGDRKRRCNRRADRYERHLLLDLGSAAAQDCSVNGSGPSASYVRDQQEPCQSAPCMVNFQVVRYFALEQFNQASANWLAKSRSSAIAFSNGSETHLMHACCSPLSSCYLGASGMQALCPVLHRCAEAQSDRPRSYAADAL